MIEGVERILTALKSGEDPSQVLAQGVRNSLVEFFNLAGKSSPIKYKEDEVLATNGATHALRVAMKGLAQRVRREKDGKKPKIALFVPYYGPHDIQARLLGCEVVKIKVKPGASPAAALEAAQKELKAKGDGIDILLINDPHNPDGASYGDRELEKLAGIIESDGIYTIHERIYGDITHDRKEKKFLYDFMQSGSKDLLVRLFSLAKCNLGMPDSHLGGVAASRDMIREIGGVMDAEGCGLSPFSLAMFVTALGVDCRGGNAAWKAMTKAEYSSNIRMFTKKMSDAGFSMTKDPGGTFYAWLSAGKMIGKNLPDYLDVGGVRVNPAEIPGFTKNMKIESAEHVTKLLLYVAGVALVPGDGFGDDPANGTFRASCANTADTLEKASMACWGIMNQIVPMHEHSAERGTRAL